jgi:2-hydroxychromene-2-carboxylate isomerase
MTGDWYFDFISPYAFLQFHRLGELDGRVKLRLKPVLFAALLDHWGQRGPAEIAPKRLFVYAQTRWLARRRGLPFRGPEAHPFNPLRLLRLALHLGVTPEIVRRLFAFVWQEGFIPENDTAWRALTTELGLEDAQTAIARPEVKEALRRNTEEAIAAGVFGVPTLMIEKKLFWGDDATLMALDYLAEPEPFRRDDELIAKLPAAAVRPAARR